MKKTIVFLLCLLTALLLAQPQSTSQAQAKPLVITHVTVIDATGAAAQPDMTVVLTGDRITALGKTGKVPAPKDAQVIDATGKFLIPGLWDMHVHTANEDFLTLFIANGITGVRDMFTQLERINQYRAAIKDGKLVGPRIIAAGPIVDGPKPVWQGSIAVSNAEEGRQAVIKVKADGSDFVKVYSLLPRDAFFAIADEAKKQHIPFAGHVPERVSAAEASDAGQKSIEHLTGVLLACSRDEEAIRAEMDKIIAAAGSSPASRTARTAANLKAVQSYDPEKAAALFARFKKNGTWQCPTLTVLRAVAHLNDPNFTNDPRLKYLRAPMRNNWNPANDFRFKDRTAEDWANSRKVYAKYLEVTGAMRKAGVEFIAGTDTPNPYCFPGFSLHDELALLVKTGFTPMEALQAATRNPAKYLGLLDSLGTIEKGKIANLVLLDADPLDEISNTQKIHAVVVNGKLITKAEIEAMLAKVEAAAKSQPNQPLGELISPTPAQLAGTWALDAQRSEGLSSALLGAQSAAWVVTWDGKQIIVLPKVVGAKGPIPAFGAFGAPKATYNLDGSETTFEATEPPGKFTHKAQWADGSKLLGLTQVATQGPVVVTTLMRCELAGDGKLLTVQQSFSGSSAKVKLVFNKK